MPGEGGDDVRVLMADMGDVVDAIEVGPAPSVVEKRSMTAGGDDRDAVAGALARWQQAPAGGEHRRFIWMGGVDDVRGESQKRRRRRAAKYLDSSYGVCSCQQRKMMRIHLNARARTAAWCLLPRDSIIL